MRCSLEVKVAGIEKCCEFSGEYPGYLMYGYKRNHIQIMPHYRKEFRGKQAILYIQINDGQYVVARKNWSYNLNSAEYAERIVRINGKTYDTNMARGRSWHPTPVSKEFWYALVVPELPGDVRGVYSNHSCKISTVKRKLKRMLRCRSLEVRYIDDLNNIVVQS
jgi:hypothetical protein